MESLASCFLLDKNFIYLFPFICFSSYFWCFLQFLIDFSTTTSNFLRISHPQIFTIFPIPYSSCPTLISLILAISPLSQYLSFPYSSHFLDITFPYSSIFSVLYILISHLVLPLFSIFSVQLHKRPP